MTRRNGAPGRAETLVIAEDGQSPCRHHWVIAPPNGPTSEGFCRICGTRREFRNSANDFLGDGISGSARGREAVS